MRKRSVSILFICSAIFLTACVNHLDLEAMQPWATDIAPPIYGEQTIGQTFVATHPGLAAIRFELATQDVKGPIFLRLKRAPDAAADLRTIEIAAPPSDQKDLLWEFPPLSDPEGQSYYALAQAPHAEMDHPLRLQSIAHEVYRPGELYFNGIELPGDLTFYTFYDYNLGLFGSDTVHALGEFWLVFPALALFWSPGFLLFRFLKMKFDCFDFWERQGLAVGASLALIPLVLLWVTQLGGAFSDTTTRLLCASVGVTSLMIAAWDSRRFLLDPSRLPELNLLIRSNVPWLLLILALGLGLRLVAIRDLTFPPWVDSVRHVLLTQLIAAGGAVPATYAPYWAGADATYHFGFHASVAAFAWLTDLPIPRAMLLVGQLFNSLMALQVYLLARWLTGRARAALLAALIVAVISAMPAYHINWGRYTELAGLLILPVAAALTVEAVKSRERKLIAVSMVVAAGLVLTHYRVFAFYICLVTAWWLVASARQFRSWRARLLELVWLAAIWVGALILLMPWILGIIAQLWLHAFTLSMNAPHSFEGDFSWDYLTAGFDTYLLMFAFVGAIIAIAARRSFSVVLMVWMGELFLIANPALFRLPGQGLVDNVSVETMWFMPLAIWCGFLIEELVASWLFLTRGKWLMVARGALVVIAAGIVLIGSARQITIVNSDGVLGIESDRAALAWIEKNVPPRSKFLINGQIWYPTLYAGTDGGYWITPLTQNETTAPPTPPSLYAIRDMPEGTEIQEFYKHVEDLSKDPGNLLAMLRSKGIGYVYLGALGGPLDPQLFLTSPGFRKLYDNGHVYIFQIAE